jgi:hypothetical protein
MPEIHSIPGGITQGTATMATAAVIYRPAHPMTVTRDMSIAGEEEVTALDVT